MTKEYNYKRIKHISYLIQGGENGLFAILKSYYNINYYSTIKFQQKLQEDKSYTITFQDLNEEGQEIVLGDFCQNNFIKLELLEPTPFDDYDSIKERIKNFEEVAIIWDDVCNFNYDVQLPSSLCKDIFKEDAEYDIELAGCINDLCTSEEIGENEKKRIANTYADKLFNAITTNNAEVQKEKREYIKESLLILSSYYKKMLRLLLDSSAQYFLSNKDKYCKELKDSKERARVEIKQPQKLPNLQLNNYKINSNKLLSKLKEYDLIDKHTKEISLANIFKKDNTSVIKWNMQSGKKGKKVYLYYFIKSLVEGEIISDKDNNKWKVASYLFTDINGENIDLSKNIPKPAEYKENVKKAVKDIISSTFTKRN